MIKVIDMSSSPGPQPPSRFRRQQPQLSLGATREHEDAAVRADSENQRSTPPVSPQPLKKSPEEEEEEVRKDLYLLWPESQEHRNLMKGENSTSRLGASIGFTLAAGCVAVMAILWPITAALSTHNPWRIVLLSIEALLGVVTLLILVVIGFFYTAARRNFYERVKTAKSRAVDLAVEKLRTDTSLKNLLVLNRRQLDDYHSSSIHQQAVAFRNAQIAAAIGFAIVVLGAILSMRQSNDTARYLTVGLSTLGTALSGYVASVFFRSYRETSREMERYYKEPFNTYEILMIERLADLDQHPQLRDKIVQRLLDRIYYQSIQAPVNEAAAQLQQDIKQQDGESSAGAVPS